MPQLTPPIDISQAKVQKLLDFRSRVSRWEIDSQATYEVLTDSTLLSNEIQKQLRFSF